MTLLTPEFRDLISSGPLAHLATINADGSPQVSVIWIGLDGDDVVSGHLDRYVKVRNTERDPRVVLSFDAPRVPGATWPSTPFCTRRPPSRPAAVPGTC